MVDSYITDLLVTTCHIKTLQANKVASLLQPATPNQGKVLHQLAQIQGARRILVVTRPKK